MMRWTLLWTGVVAMAAAARGDGIPARDPGRLSLLGAEYPRVFFFRGAEGAARRATDYEAWDAEHARLMGIMGKCLDEEIVGHTARNPEYFNRFKERHPSQAVLLHFNGNSRDPRYETGTYFPGHWVYRRATRILADVPAAAGETDIRVEDASDFQTGAGRYRTSNDDIALFGVTPGGTHDWAHCEQVQLVSVDAKAGTIRVRRGCYGTKPLAFKAGAARAAAHAVEGPWGKTNHLLWFYNYATHCPRDPQGKTCTDRLVDDLARWFAPDGILGRLDGMEFDVLFNVTHGDTDGDGVEDDGVVDGINRYGIGVFGFARQLRERMGEGFILQADGALGPGGQRSQRAFGLFNGIESEGWPNLNDWDFKDWSGGLNRHLFWQAHARAPAFSYFNHKWVEGVPGKPGETQNADVPFSRHRLSFAAAQFVDAMVCAAYAPPRGKRGVTPLWDEFVQGAENRPGWLGRPEAPPVRLAAATPDLLAGADLSARIRGAVAVSRQGAAWVVSARDPAAADLSFTLADLPARGSNLTVLLTLRGEPMKGYPDGMARFAEVVASGGEAGLVDRVPDSTGMQLRGAEETAIDRGSGASVRRAVAHDIGGRGLPAIHAHPPYKTGRGSAFWTRDADVPAGAELRFEMGMSEKAPERSDGVWFQVWAAPLVGATPGAFVKLFEAASKEHRWIPQVVPLGDWAGKRVRFKFVADCGPKDNATTDHASWGDVKVVRSGGGTTRPVRMMTWVGARDFQSSYFVREAGSTTVDLAVTVEGAAPVTIAAVSAHAAPDAMARVFERGLVLANPSLAPVTFDLKSLSPGRTYRRLRATAGQDAEANNGAPVGDTVTLGERDALFLVRTAGGTTPGRP
ncbi:MAG: hypothetical protein FJ221_17810 [Lentisphaerae bacterium]|nr:hypothetical protein [Lentisphaerota bacterium]